MLAAIGLSPKLARASIRFGLGRGNTAAEIDYVADRLVEEVTRARRSRAGSALP